MGRYNGPSPRVPAVARFGVFELDLRSGELRKHGVRLRIQPRSLQILQALLETPGQVVTREELQRRLWPSGVFVDYDSGLNTAVNRLRLALGDSAESPRYIETFARTGYRFIAPVEIVDAAVRGPTLPAARKTHASRLVALGVTAIALALAVSWVAFRRSSAAAFQFQQVTFRRGQVWGARFAPDGRAILYTANWDNGARQLFLTNPFSPESRELGFKD